MRRKRIIIFKFHADPNPFFYKFLLLVQSGAITKFKKKAQPKKT